MKKTCLFLSILAATIGFSQNHHWGYEGDSSPEHWGEFEEGKQCGIGKFQSPINISQSKFKKDLSPILFNYGSGEIEDIEDNGHSLQFDFKSGSSITYNKKVYSLVQFHAHEESEHTVDRVRYPLELHFVHKANDGSVLVIGVLVKEGDINSYFEKLEVFKSLKGFEKIDTSIKFNPENLYPKNKSYFTYLGSLTTPPCTENVTWIIFKNPITMTNEEIDEIKYHLPKTNNRPLQPLNGRSIFNN